MAIRLSPWLARTLGIALTLGPGLCTGAPGAAPAPAVLSTGQVTDALYETVNWYRLSGAQSATPDQAGDTLILYANGQIAADVVHLALDMARADAELLSSQDSRLASPAGTGSSAAQLDSERLQLDTQAKQIQSSLQVARAAAGGAQRTHLVTQISELESELAMVKARSNLLATEAQFVNGTDARNVGANALKAHVAAIEASLPHAASAASASATSLDTSAATRRLGIWDLAATALDISNRLGAIDSIDRRTAQLDLKFQTLSAIPSAAIKTLSARSDALTAEADHASSATMKAVRDQLDTVAWQFQQTSSIVLPLGKAHVLLEQYRHNLSEWRDILRRQQQATVMALGVRVGVLVLVLAALFIGAELWRRAVLRFEHDLRRRHQWLLVRRITLWVLVLVVIGFTFVSEISSFATFAGLITAGLAVAMQSVLVSMVGYLFLIGKYGVRVGDRVQIGTVSGEVVELGLVRMHLMELNPEGDYAPTGRVVAFANSVVFQASGGLFRQIPGINFAWHDVTLTLPAGIDYPAVKEAMRAAVTEVIRQYQEYMVFQTGQLSEALASHHRGTAVAPRVQLHFSSTEVQVHVWYPVYLPRAAEIDERVSQELWKVIDDAQKQAGSKALTAAASGQAPLHN